MEKTYNPCPACGVTRQLAPKLPSELCDVCAAQKRGKRECQTCHRVKPLSHFAKSAHSWGGVSRYCRACVKEKAEAAKAKATASRVSAYIRSRYG